MVKNRTSKSTLILLCLNCVIIGFLSLYNMNNLSQLSVLNDEFGYWANAAHLVGYDWSGVSFMSPYYSYGYSFLLAPLFLIENAISRYHAALFLNLFFYIISYLISYKCARILFTSLSSAVTALFCMVPALYCNNLLQANIAWTEGLLYLYFWLIFYLLLLIENHPRRVYFLLLAVLSIHLYTIHQRSLGVIISLVIAVFLLKVTNQISTGNFLVFILPFVFCLFCTFIIKADFKTALWTSDSSTLVNTNEYSGQLYKVISIFSDWETFLYAIKGFLGKFFYLFASSCLLIFYGIWSFLKLLYTQCKNSNKVSSLSIFCIFSLLSTISINTIFTVGALRIDAILYGRYTEFVIGPILFMGIFYLLTERVSWKTCMIGLSLFLISGLLIRNYIHSGTDYMATMSVGTSLFYNISDDEFAVRYAFLIPTFLGIITLSMQRFKNNLYKMLPLVPVFIFWLMSSNHVLTKTINVWQEKAAGLLEIASILENSDNSYPIYFTYNDGYPTANWDAERIQYLVPDQHIQHITYKDLYTLNENHYLLHVTEEYIDTSKYSALASNNGFILSAYTGTTSSQ